MKIALCILATNKYIDFVQPLIDSADKYFLIDHHVEYLIWTDQPNRITSEAGRPIRMKWLAHERWPMITLKRYETMRQTDLNWYDGVYYIDADMLFVDYVGREILEPLVAVQHPGYYRGGGAWENNNLSAAYVPKMLRKHYVAGGFQGGLKYATTVGILAKMIEGEKIIPAFHDESYWNRYYAYNMDFFTLLDPSYCMVEELYKRRLWGIESLHAKIIALQKNHKEVRS